MPNKKELNNEELEKVAGGETLSSRNNLPLNGPGGVTGSIKYCPKCKTGTFHRFNTTCSTCESVNY